MEEEGIVDRDGGAAGISDFWVLEVQGSGDLGSRCPRVKGLGGWTPGSLEVLRVAGSRDS